MKPINWIFTGLLILTFGSLRAQQDTTFNKNKLQPQPSPTVPQQQTTPPVPQPQPTTPARETNTYLQQDRTLIHQDQIPQPLRQTLQAPQYNGWENVPVYQDRTTGEYSLELKTGTTPPKVYRFDKNGRLIQNPNKPGSPNDDQ